MEMEELLRDLISVPGVCGYEGPIRERIRELVRDHVDRLETDVMGNLVAIREGSGAGNIALFAHMDEIGLVVANVTGEGFIRFKKMGGIDDRILPSRHVRLFTRGGQEFAGVIAWTPPHMALEGEKDRDKAVSWKDMVIDVGARDAEELQTMGIRVGDPIVFSKEFSRLANGLIASRGMDDRAGCAVLITLIRMVKDLVLVPRVSFVFTVQEEYGLRGASVAAHRARPDAAFVVDTASAPDFPGVPPVYKDQFRVGQGPVLRLVDTRMIAGQEVREFVERLAVEQGIPYQLGVVGGSTDAAAVQLAREGVPVLPICLPCRYTHATVEVVSLNDLEATVTLLQKTLESYPEIP